MYIDSIEMLPKMYSHYLASISSLANDQAVNNGINSSIESGRVVTCVPESQRFVTDP